MLNDDDDGGGDTVNTVKPMQRTTPHQHQVRDKRQRCFDVRTPQKGKIV